MEKLRKTLYICKLVFKSVLMHNALIIYSDINLSTYFRTRHTFPLSISPFFVFL